MAQVFLYPAPDESPLDEDGNPFPSTGARVTMNAYYEGQCRQGLLVRSDPNAFSSVAQPAVYAPFSLGYTTSQLTSLSGVRDGRYVTTVGYATASDGLGWLWQFQAGGSVGSNDYHKRACPDGCWVIVPVNGSVAAMALGAGLGAGNDLLRTLAAQTALGTAGGEVYLHKGNYVWSDLTTFAFADNVHLRGSGNETVIRRTNAYGALDARGCTNVTISDLVVEMDYWQPFVRIVDCTEGASYVTIRRLVAYMTEDAIDGIDTLGHTLHAVIANDSDHITVEECRFKYLQVKLSSDASATNMRVERNYIDNPIDFAVSCAPSSGVLEIEYVNIVVRGNIINNPRHSGVFYFGADSESGRIERMYNLAVEDNIVRQDVNLAGVQVLIHLADDSRDISVCRNQLRNDDTTLNENSNLIRIRSNSAFATVDGLRISENTLYGCDLAGIDLDCQGRNIQVQNNIIRNTRGIWLRAIQGSIVNAKISGNFVGGRSFAPIQGFATGGNITGLSISDNTMYDAQGAFEHNVGIYLEAAATRSISGAATDNAATIVDTGGIAAEGRLNYFIWTAGSGSVTMRCAGNDGSAANIAFALSSASTSVLYGYANLGTGAPNSHSSPRGGTVVISGASTSAAVTLTPAENDASYFPTLTVGGISGAAVVTAPYPTSIATGGFTVNVPTAPGVGTTITIRWEISRP